MKKLCFGLFLSLFLTGFSFAQNNLEAGSSIIHGGLSFTSTSYEHSDNATNVLSVTPGILFFLIDNLAIGGDLLYQRTSHGDWNSSTFGIGPALRFYLPMGTAQPFVNLGFTFTSSSDKDIDGSLTNLLFSGGGGVDIMIAKNVAVEPFLMYHIGSSKWSKSSTSSSYSIFEVGVGITSFLGK